MSAHAVLCSLSPNGESESDRGKSRCCASISTEHTLVDDDLVAPRSPHPGRTTALTVRIHDLPLRALLLARRLGSNWRPRQNQSAADQSDCIDMLPVTALDARRGIASGATLLPEGANVAVVCRGADGKKPCSGTGRRAAIHGDFLHLAIGARHSEFHAADDLIRTASAFGRDATIAAVRRQGVLAAHRAGGTHCSADHAQLVHPRA
jgi:hypothetical protein